MAYNELENNLLDNASFKEINYNGGPGEGEDPKPKKKQSASGSGLDLPANKVSNKNVFDAKTKNTLKQLVKITDSNPEIKKRNQEVLENMQHQEQVKKLDKLTDDQNQIISGLLKQNNLNPNDIKSYSNGAIKDYIDTSLKLNYYNSKNPDKAEEMRAKKRLDDAKGFWENVSASLDHAKQWVDEGVNKWTLVGGQGDAKGTGISQDKYESIKKKMRKYEEPVVNSELQKEKNEYTQLTAKVEAAKKRMIEHAEQRRKNSGIIGNVTSTFLNGGQISQADKESARIQQEYSRLTKAQEEAEKRMEQLGSYLENKDTLWDGLDNVDYSRIVGTGLVDAFSTYTVKNKVKKGEQLTEADNEYLLQKAKTEKFKQTTKQTIERDRFWTRTGEGTGESAVFMGQMVVTAPVGGLAGGAIKSIVSPLASKVAMSAAIKSAGMVEGRLATKALEKLATKGIGYIESGVVGSGELLAQSFAMPSTYENMSRKFIGQTSIITDKDGNEKVLLTASAKKAFEKQSQNSVNILNEEEKRINSKKQLTDDDYQRLNEISMEKGLINENLNAIYNVRTSSDGKQEYYVPEDISATDAFIYGYTESLKEMAAERYVGTLGSRLSKPAGALYSRTLGKTMLGKKILSPIGNATSKFWSKGQNFVNGKFNTARLGLLSNNLAYHTGGAKMFHNLPGEVLEEIAVQLTPTYTEDYSHQLKELANPNFYVDVLAQTFLMGAGFSSVSTANHLGNYTFNKDYRNNIRDLRNTKREIQRIYNNIDNSIDDNDLAVHIGMNTGDTSFNIQDYQAKVAELRNNNDFAEANRLEQNAYMNLGLKALRTGTLSEYKEKLERISSSDKFSDDTKQNVTNILSTLPKLEEIQNKYSNRINYGKIVDLAVNNIVYEKSKNELSNKTSELRQKASDILDTINRFEPNRLNVQIDDTTDTITVDDIQFANFSEMSKEKADKINSLITEHPELNQLVELSHIGDLYDFVNYENNKQMNYELNPANYDKIRREYIQERNRQLLNTVNEDNAEEVRNELEQSGELTPEINSQINQAVESQVVNSNNNVPATPVTDIQEEMEFETPDAQEVMDQDVSKLSETVRETANTEFTRISEANLFDDELSSPDSFIEEGRNNDALSLQPLNLDDSPKQNNVIKEYTNVLNELNNNINNEASRDITAKEAFGLFANAVGLDVAEQHFNMFKKAFENTGIQSDVNWNTLYNKYFQAMSKFNFNSNEVIETPTTVEEIITDDQETNKEIEENNTPVAYTQDNTEIKYVGRKISVPMNKIPFLGVKYRAVLNPIDNTVTYVDDSEGELNNDGSSNLNIILNPDILIPGKIFTLEIPTDWRMRTVSEWSRNEGGFLIQRSITMEEWMTKNNVEEGSKEWIDKVPMDMIVDGNNIGYGVHDTAWWNTRNVADFKDATIGNETLSEEQAKQHQQKVIEKGREMSSNIRQSVFNGNNEMVITEREEGHTLTNKNNELKSLFNSNPDAQIAIGSPQGFILNKGDNGNEYFKGVVVNQNNIEKGHVYMISRLGTTVVDGKTVPTYVAHKVVTNHNQDSLVDLVRSRQRMYDAADILNGTGKFSNPSQEQVAWANRVKDQIKVMTGVSIDNVSITGTSVQYTGLGELRQLYPLPVKDTKGLMLLPQINNFSKQKLPIVHQDGSVTNYKSNAGEGYKAMLMDNLYTQKKFHTIIDDAGNNKYILDVQPRIKFDLNTRNIDNAPVQEQVVENSVTELYHTSNSVLTLDDISVEPRQTRQGRKGQYGGFYTYDNLEDIELFAKGNNSSNIHKISLVPGTQIFDYSGSIERLNKEKLDDLRSQGHKIIRGKSLFGKTEIIVIDKSAISSVGLVNQESTGNDSVIDTITVGQTRRVVQYLFNNILASVDISKKFTDKDIINRIKEAYENHLSQLQNSTYKAEYQYLLDNKDSILGLNEFSNNDNTVKSELESFLSQQFEIENDTDTGIQEDNEVNLSDEGIFEKNQNKAAFENNVRTSLSTKMKIFFSGITKTNKNVTEEFAGLDEYYTSDEIIEGLQSMLVNVSNDPKSFRDKIQSQVDKNPEEFGFLQQVLDKFNSANIEVQKEILFRLNQTKNEMFFVMYSKSKAGKYTLMVYDANSRNPHIKIKSDWRENLKQSDMLINFGDTYRLKEDKATGVLDQFNSWKGNYSNISNQEYINWLSNFGIQVSDKTIQDYKDGIVEGNVNFEGNFTGGIFNVLAKNLQTALSKQVQNGSTVFKYRAESKNDTDAFNILTDNNNGFIKTMVDVEVNNTFNVASSMYIAGKTINAYSQPNYTSEQLRKLKDFNNSLGNDLRESAFSKNSLLLDLMTTNNKIKNALSIGYISLQALKQQGQKVYQDSGVVDLSSQDYDLLMQGFFQSEGAYFVNQEMKNKGISLREIKMAFPTLSDSSQLFVFNTVGLNLNKGNFNVTESGDFNINNEVLEIMYSQLVKPDLERIYQFLKSNKQINIQGHNLGSQIFTMLPNMNTLPIDVNGTDVKFLTIVHDRINKGASIDDIYKEFKSDIHSKINETIKSNVEKKIRLDGNDIKGTWVDNGFLDDKMNVNFLDTKYLNSRGSGNTVEQLQIAAFDYTINYYLNQAQIQMLFAGDINNYVQDKQEKKFTKTKNGIDVTKPIVSVAVDENQLEVEQKVYNDIIKATSVNMSKRLKELISPGNRIADSKGEQYIQLMLNDVEESSTTLEQIVKQFYPELYQDNKNDIEKLKSLENEIRRGIEIGEPVDLIEKEYSSLSKRLQDQFPDIADYFNITATDAQEYTTWQEHLHILLNQGRVSKEVHESLTNKLASQSKNGINADNKLTKEEKKIVFQPIKPLHAGMYFEDVYNNNNEIVGKNQRYIYVKTSSFPLLPEMTSGLQLDNLRKNVETLENKTGKRVRVSYQSGNKVGAIKSAINISELYNENYNAELENKMIGSSVILDRENFSIQQDKPFKTDKNIEANKRDEINRGTQFEKIILGNGINKITEKIFPNTFDTQMLEELGISSGNISGADLYRIYTHLYANEQKVLKNQLYNSLGLNLNGDWNNSVETLEHIKSALDKRLSNKQDKEILELTYIVPVLENGRYINKYYTKQEVQEQGLKPVSAEFNIPIWMSPNSRKFESVLNSIVNNKLVNLKLPGFSSPVASQEGFRIKEESDIKDVKGIIVTENYDAKQGLKATHNSDGSLKYAQVMVASKFRVKKKNEDTGKYTDELIDLSTYTKTLEDGRIVLDMERVSPELLQMFSFRIPTSAHQSGALIEIVGFLPHTQGDLMIVPKDHTTQIGEDYDIDTRYVYTQNYRLDNKGNIRKIDSTYVKSRIEQLDNSFENEREWNSYTEDILNIFDEFRNNEEIQNIFAQDNMSRERKHQILKDSLNHLLIENNIVDVYKSVFSSTDERIQKMIGSTLSTKFAEDTAEAIDNKLNSAKDDSNFSIFDDAHQKSILRLGASGKLGIGVHSNWVVLNSLFQQMETAPTIVAGYNSETGTSYPWRMTVGNFTSNGKLGQINALRPDSNIPGFTPRLLSVINMESQNSSTDNQKLQIMGRRNENKYTINAFALMSNLGFDKDMVNGQEMSLPSLFISQPIIRRYVELKENFDSITADYQDNVEQEIMNTLLKEFGEGVDIVQSDFGPRMSDEQMSIVERTELTGQKLYDSLIEGSNAQQWALFEKFVNLNQNAANITKVQQLANIDSSGLGVSYFNTVDKKNTLSLFDDTDLNIDGVSKIFGDKIFILSEQIEQREPQLLEEGYIRVEQNDSVATYIKPTSPLSAKLVNAISTGYNLWSNVLPFENEFIDNQINDILKIAGKENGTKATTELKYKIISDMKDYIYSYSNIGIFNNDVNKERETLFFDNDTNESLASYLNKLKKSKNELFNQPFFKELEFVLNKGTEPSLIKYSSNDRTAYNKNAVHNQLNILNDSQNSLPDFNGEVYTWEKLARDLTKYALLSNQENGAIGFRQHIPMTILNKYNVTDNLRKYSGVGQNLSHNLLLNGDFKALMKTVGSNKIEDNKIEVYNYTPLVESLMERINTKYGTGTVVYDASKRLINVNDTDVSNFNSIFTKQFFQHNPDQARKLNFKNAKSWMNTANDRALDKLQWFTVKSTMEMPDYYSIRDSKNSTFLLFELDSNGIYRKVNTLGAFGFNEYSPFSYNHQSLIGDNNVNRENIQTVQPVELPSASLKDMVNNYKLNSGVINFIESITNDSKFKNIAELIKPFVNDITINVIDLKGMGNALYVPLSENSNTVGTDLGQLTRGQIYVNQDLVKSGNTEKLNYAIMEEIVHSITINEVNRYIDTSKSYLDKDGNINLEYKTDDIPAYIVKLVSLFKQGSKHVLEKMVTDTSLEEAIKRINDQKQLFNNLSKGIQTNTDTVEPIGQDFKRNVYRTLNLGEFIAGVMLDSNFRNEMNQVQYRSTGQSILSQFAQVIARIVDKLSNGNRVANSITSNTFDAVMSLLTHQKSETAENSPVSNSVITQTMRNTDIEAEQFLEEFGDPDTNIDGSEISLQPVSLSEIESNIIRLTDTLDIPTC